MKMLEEAKSLVEVLTVSLAFISSLTFAYLFSQILKFSNILYYKGYIIKIA